MDEIISSRLIKTNTSALFLWYVFLVHRVCFINVKNRKRPILTFTFGNCAATTTKFQPSETVWCPSSTLKVPTKLQSWPSKATKGFFFRWYFKVSARTREEVFTEAPGWKKESTLGLKFRTTIYQPLHFLLRQWICTIMTSPKTNDCHRLKCNTTFQHVSRPDLKAFSPIWNRFKVDISSIFYSLRQIFLSRFLVVEFVVVLDVLLIHYKPREDGKRSTLCIMHFG